MACAGFLKLFGIHPGLSAQPTVASARAPTSAGFNPVFRRAGNRGIIVWLLLGMRRGRQAGGLEGPQI
jgi:hypothetical protein